ncbi:putative Serine/threonine-protein phosphatase PP1 isozyme 7 [Blattamonas nauphoetae]|uniref:Serine/threonine-protein phosphatase n=1 Tax=Blattamonas nauphoetae TaxID=2049346 RepID=A0ABQ9XQB7_9EUKA|nr:putative Serine/threonine-protein phosphatase PP1 isozyme 7 [Blattamonas nauphoetae]
MSLDFSFLNEGGTRVSHSSICVDDMLFYFFGESGKHENREYLKNALRYDLSNDSMNIVELFVDKKPATARASHTTSMVTEDKFICFGGNCHLKLMNDTLVGTLPDPNSSYTQISFETLPTTKTSPPHRRGHAATTLGGTRSVFMVGGNSTQSCLNDSFIFDAGSASWREVGKPSKAGKEGATPPIRTHHAIIPLSPGGDGSLNQSGPLTSSGLSGSNLSGGNPSCVFMFGGQCTKAAPGKSVPPTVYEDAWIFDINSETWHSVPLKTYGQCKGVGKRVGHTLVPVLEQNASCLLWGGGPDVGSMLMCNDGYLIDLRNFGMLPLATTDSSKNPNSYEYSPIVLQSGSVPRRSIAPRMFHSMDMIGDDVYVIFGGYAGHRTCGGVWKATLMGTEMSKREKQRKTGKPSLPTRARGGTAAGANPDIANPNELYHHLPFSSSPFRPSDPNRININTIRMKEEGSTNGMNVVKPNRELFPDAYNRDAPTTGTLPRGNTDMRSLIFDSTPPRAVKQKRKGTPAEMLVDPAIDVASITSFELPGQTSSPSRSTTSSVVSVPADNTLLDVFIDAMMAEGENFSISPQQLLSLTRIVTPLFDQEPSLLTVNPPTKVYGDLHGNFAALLTYFGTFGDPRSHPHMSFLFLGDYVDRGPCSVLVVALLFALKIRYPDRIFLLRGNHEARAMCGEGHGYPTLLDDCTFLFEDSTEPDMQPRAIWTTLVDTFDYLPYAAVIGRTIFAVHGGLSHSLPTLNQIYLLKRGKREEQIEYIPDGVEVPRGAEKKVPASGSFSFRFGINKPPVLTPAQELMWNDASRQDDQEQTWVPNSQRRCGYWFNNVVVDNFCKQNGLKLIVRGHEVCTDGFDYFAKRKLITLFSAPQYCGMDNSGAIMDVRGDGQVSLEMIRSGVVESIHMCGGSVRSQSVPARRGEPPLSLRQASASAEATEKAMDELLKKDRAPTPLRRSSSAPARR